MSIRTESKEYKKNNDKDCRNVHACNNYMYEFKIQCRDGVRTFTGKNNSLKFILQNLLKECIEQDDTGVFFELEDCDDEIQKIIGFQKINGYGVIVKEVHILNSNISDYARVVRELREQCGLTMDAAAELTGISAGSFKRIENDHPTCSKNTQKLMANFFMNYVAGNAI